MCIGEHVIKTYCRQQKVVALSSAEAELYAAVAASAEAIALVVYCKDLGMDMEAELYCDSSAALGIAHRAGIGKVRHLRTQGLWVQEVRISGRVKYKKVLGAKNPADLLTKHMSSKLSRQHLETLNASLIGGRAESAPTLDSIVTSRYEEDDDMQHAPRVRFYEKVQIRKIPVEGKGRKLPERNSRKARQTRWQGKWTGEELEKGEREDGKEAGVDVVEKEIDLVRTRALKRGTCWADVEDDEDSTIGKVVKETSGRGEPGERGPKGPKKEGGAASGERESRATQVMMSGRELFCLDRYPVNGDRDGHPKLASHLVPGAGVRRTETPSENSCKNSCESLEHTWGSARRDRRAYRWVGERSHRCDRHSSISGAEGGALDVGLHDSACSILFFCVMHLRVAHV